MFIIIQLFIFIIFLNAEPLYEKDIKNIILNPSNYDKMIRPSQIVTINIDIIFKQFVNFNEKSQILTTSSYLYTDWIDYRLAWNLTEYPLLYIILIANQLWLPDLYIINSADTDGFIKITASNLALIKYDGTVIITNGLNSNIFRSIFIKNFILF